MKKLSSGRKTIIFTVLLLTAFMLANYDKSGAKYYKNENDSITYNLGFEALTKDGNGKFSIIFNKSSHSSAYFKYTVPRNTIMTSEDSIDKYRILVDPSCEIKKVNNTAISNGNNTATFNYSDNTARDITVEYSCPVDKVLITNSTKYFDTDVIIYEQMTSDYKEFVYLKQTSEVYDINENLPAEIVGDYHVLTILDSDDQAIIDSKIDAWIAANINNYGGNGYGAVKSALYNQLLLDYFKKGYNPDLKNYDDTVVRGINIDHNGNTYTFEINDDFLAYAVTDKKIQTPPPIFKPLYFADLTKTDSELQEIFEYYVDKYIYSKTSADYTTLMNYVNSKGGVATVLRGTGTINGLNYSDGLMIIYNNILTNATQTTSVINNNATNSINSVNKAPGVVEQNTPVEVTKPVETTTPVETTPVETTPVETVQTENTLVNKILVDVKTLTANEKIQEFIKVDKDLIRNSKEGIKLNDYIIYNIDGEHLLINIYTDEAGVINSTTKIFDENVEMDLATATKISIATNYASDYANVVENLNKITEIIDAKYATNYTNIVTVDMLTNYEVGKGLYIYDDKQMIKAYLLNTMDENQFGTLVVNTNSNEDVINGEEVNIPSEPEKVLSGDTPNEDIPIFDEIVATEPVEVTTPTVSDSEKVEENPDSESEKTSEVDENSKVADTTIEKEFENDIQEVSKLIDDMKEFVGDAEEVSAEDEAIAEVDELIETVKDYINEA